MTQGGKTYNTIQIGTQCWLKESLNIGTLIVSSQEQTNNGIIEKYCYNDLESNCAVYGGLYQWNELMNYTTSSSSNPSGRQGICPTGWHLPSDAEYCQLETYLDPTFNCAGTGPVGTDAGGKMKESGAAHWGAPNAGATNSSGFTALPGGHRSLGGGFSQITGYGFLWSSTENSATHSWSCYQHFSYAQGGRDPNTKLYGFSGRCVKD